MSPPGNTNQKKNAPLAGYRVLDLAGEQGVFGSRLLADMGAGVIRIEKPRKKPETAPAWENLGKRRLTLDLAKPDGRDILLRLVRTADILVASFPREYAEKNRLTYRALSRINRRLIMASITGFGQSGPYRDLMSSDAVASAMGGQTYLSGAPDRPPLKLFGQQVYYTAGLFAANGVMLALWQRHATGRGQHIDISLQECAAATLDHALVRYCFQGKISHRTGGRYWNDAFCIFLCRDGYILLSIMLQWDTLVCWLDAEGMAEDLTDTKWQDRDYRLGHINHIIEVLGKWTLTHDIAELVEKGQLMHFPWAPVNSISDLLASPQLQERHFFISGQEADTGRTFTCPSAPARLSQSPWQAGRAALPGQDNQAILMELGFKAEDISNLYQRGVI